MKDVIHLKALGYSMNKLRTLHLVFDGTRLNLKDEFAS